MSGAGTDKVASFALTRNGNDIACVPFVAGAIAGAVQPVAVSELQSVGFSLEHRDPDVEYAVLIGDVQLAPGRAFGPSFYWEDGHYFESARGPVRVQLRALVVGDAPTGWRIRAQIDVNVVPTKLGELRYDSLVNDIRRTAAGLIFDIVSKMLRGVRYARGVSRVAFEASHLELANLRRLWSELAGPLDVIVRDPHLRTGRCVQLRSYSGTGVLDANMAWRLATRGVDPRSRGRTGPVTIPGEVLTPTGDTVEHRIILWFLRLLLRRVQECVESARNQILLIEMDRELRDVPVGSGPTLYEEVDVPKITRLQESVGQGRELTAQIGRATRAPLFRDVRPQDGDGDTPVFQHVDAYYRFGVLMRRYLAASLVVLEAGDGERLKATSRLYEHWVFLRLAEALRSCGLRGGDIEGVVRRLTRHRFVLDLDDDVVLMFHADHGRVVRLRYEPWILPLEVARDRGEALCSGAEGAALAWRPDVLIEFIDGSEVIYAVVVDSKYSTRIHDNHWSRVEKYARIRTVSGRRQVVRQVWLAHPGENAGMIRCRDTTVTWTPSGPDRPRDEIIMGELGLRPLPGGWTSDAEDEDPSTVALEFVLGLMRYMGFSATG